MTRPDPADLKTQAEQIEAATDAELADACSKLVLIWFAPLEQAEIDAIQSIVTNFERAGSMPEDARKRLITILLRMLAPTTN